MASEFQYTNDGGPALRAAAAAAYMRRPLFPAVRWSAVFAGVVVGISVQLVLALLGIATGLTGFGVSNGQALTARPLLWAGFSMLVAAFVGGYVAARMSGLKRKADGVLHGAVSWAVTTIMFAVLATSVGGTLLSGVFNNMNRAAYSSAAEPAMGGMMSGLPGKMDAQSLRRFQQSIHAGQRDQAIEQLVISAGIERNYAEQIVDQALILSGAPDTASPSATPLSRAETEERVKGIGNAAWLVFAAVALALAIGIAGGALGAASARRLSWDGVPPDAS